MPAPTFDFDLFGSGETLHARKDNFNANMNTALTTMFNDLLRNQGKIFGSRAAAVSFGQGELPSLISRIITVESNTLVVRSPESQEDALFGSSPYWGVSFRVGAGEAFSVMGVIPLINVGGTANAITADMHSFAANLGIQINERIKFMLIPVQANTGNVTLQVTGDSAARRVLDTRAAELPAGFLQANRPTLIQRMGTGANAVYRVINDVGRKDLDDLGQQTDASATEIRTLASAADERSQDALATANLSMETLSWLAAQVNDLRNAAQNQERVMTTYTLPLTQVNTTPTVIIQPGEVTDLKLVNRSGSETIGIAFGDAPASVASCPIVLGPGEPTGAVLDTSKIPTVAGPIYAIASGNAQLSGTFSVPLDSANPNWETDFQDLVDRMVSAGASVPSLPWQEAYRRLYSALRRENLLNTAGIFVPAAHALGAALVNWAGSNTMTIGGGTPSFTEKLGFSYDGVDDFHDTGVNLNAYFSGGAPQQVGAAVWSGNSPIGTQRAALGDGAFELHPTRTATVVAGVGWMTSNATDLLTTPTNGFVAISRSAADRYTMYGPGAAGVVHLRSAINFVPNRNIYMGATNSNAGVGKFFNGNVKAAIMGRSFSTAQIRAAQVAFDQYFKRIEGIA